MRPTSAKRRSAAGRLAVALGLLWVGSWPTAAWGDRLPAETGVLLPIQDRLSRADIAAVVEETLFLTLGERLRRPAGLRDVQRRLRLRDLASASPQRLKLLCNDLEAEWLLSVTLLEVGETPVPYVTLAAQAYVPGESKLGWVRFESLSGLDERRVLGRGEIGELEEVARRAAVRLVSDPQSGETRKPRVPLRSTGHRLPSLRPSDLGRIAVMPFDAVNERRPELAAEAVTFATLTALRQQGFEVLLPGLVGEVQRAEGPRPAGQVDGSLRRALRSRAGADSVLTGTVEIFEPESGLEPRPRVALSARLIDAESGRILWMHGVDHTGWDGQKLFGRGRLYTEGALALELIQSLILDLAGTR